MRCEIVLTDTAKAHYRALDARWQSLVRDRLVYWFNLNWTEPALDLV